MNTLGNIFRISIYGESHGEGVGVLIDGIPAGIALNVDDFLEDLGKRKPGAKGTTKRIESDYPHILSGIYNGYTTGAPMNIFFKNENKNSRVYMDFQSHPRPGHADFTATEKYKGFNDLRGGGHFSGRLTLGLVAGGVLGRKILGDVKVKAKLVTLGTMEVGDNLEEINDYLQEISLLGDSLGGIIQCEVENLPIGLGEPFFDSVESKLAHGLFSVPGLKGVEFGAGFLGTTLKGSEYNDNFINPKGTTDTNNNGGINGGISNGNKIVFRVAIKPTASIFMEQKTFNFKEEKLMPLKIEGRHDVAFVLRVPVVIEAVTNIVLADLLLQNINR